VNNGFSPEMTHNDVTGGCDLSQNVQACLADQMIHSVTF